MSVQPLNHTQGQLTDNFNNSLKDYIKHSVNRILFKNSTI